MAKRGQVKAGSEGEELEFWALRIVILTARIMTPTFTEY